MVEVPLIVISRVVPVALGGVYFVAEAVVRTLLTSYEPGLASLQILLVGTFFSSVPRGLSSFFITLRRQSQTVHLYLMAIGLNMLLVWWLLSSGYGLAGAATGTSISLAMFGLGMVVLAMRYFMSTRHVIMFVLRLFWPGAFALALVWLANEIGALLVGEAHGILNRLVSALIFLVSVVTMVAVSYLTAPPPEEKTRGLTFATLTEEERRQSRSTWNWVDVAASSVVLLAVVAAYLYFTG